MLAAESIVTFIARLVSPCLNAVAMLKVIFPHALVLSSVHVFVNAAPIGLVISPISIVNVSIDVYEAAFAMCSILSPFSTVLGSIVPCLLTEAIAEASLPLACVDGSCFESVRSTRFSLLVWIVNILGYGLASFLLREIFATSKLFGPKE